MTALDQQIEAVERRLHSRRAAWTADASAVRQRMRDAASSPMALLTAVAVGFGLDRLRARPDSRPPAADFYDRGGLQPLALFADALNIASMLLALRAQSKGAPPSERTRD